VRGMSSGRCDVADAAEGAFGDALFHLSAAAEGRFNGVCESRFPAKGRQRAKRKRNFYSNNILHT